jgi:putative redox protein
MKAHLKWTEGMKFEAESGGNIISTDAKAPLGQGKGMTPKELVAAGMGGCTAMDVVALLKKYKQAYDSFEVDIDIVPSTEGHPVVFKSATITFLVTGAVDKSIYLEAVHLSQTKYCGVSAMLAKAFPISYVVMLNNEKIGEGVADFGGTDE